MAKIHKLEDRQSEFLKLKNQVVQLLHLFADHYEPEKMERLQKIKKIIQGLK